MLTYIPFFWQFPYIIPVRTAAAMQRVFVTKSGYTRANMLYIYLFCKGYRGVFFSYDAVRCGFTEPYRTP